MEQSSIRQLKAEVQQHFQRRFLRFAFKGQLLDPSASLSEVGVRDGDSIDAISQSLRLASTDVGVALYVEGGAMGEFIFKCF